MRDAQRSARDTEILVTLVRVAAEMRNSFSDMRNLLGDSEDVIINEVQMNTDRSVQKAINGPRPLPPSAARSLRQGSQDEMFEDPPTKRRNVFRRALKGLSMKSSNDLGKIEDMLVQLLGDVEGLKVAQGLQPGSHPVNSYDDLRQEGNYENDRGYEPEGNAGTSNAVTGTSGVTGSSGGPGAGGAGGAGGGAGTYCGGGAGWSSNGGNSPYGQGGITFAGGGAGGAGWSGSNGGYGGGGGMVITQASAELVAATAVVAPVITNVEPTTHLILLLTL